MKHTNPEVNVGMQFQIVGNGKFELQIIIANPESENFIILESWEFTQGEIGMLKLSVEKRLKQESNPHHKKALQKALESLWNPEVLLFIHTFGKVGKLSQ